MPIKTGNIIDYRGDPGLDNEGDDGGNGDMGFMGGLGAPGARESKQVSSSTENGIPTEQAIRIFIGTAIVLFSIYLVLKVFIVDRADWSLLIGILSLVGTPVLLVFADRLLKHQTPNFYAGAIRKYNSIIYGYNLAAVILLFLILAFIGYIVVEFYVSSIVPQMTYTLDQQAHVVAFICAVIGLIVAYFPFKKFFTTQLTNSLRDSDSKYATASLQIENEWRLRRANLIEGEFTVNEEEGKEKTETEPNRVLVYGNIERSLLPSPKDLFKTAMEEFLDGIRDKKWTTEERSWKQKRLNRSGYNLTAIGDELRESLIAARWARWNHPTQKSQGWDLLHDPETTKNGYLNGTTNGVINEDYSGTTGQDSERTGGDADRGA